MEVPNEQAWKRFFGSVGQLVIQFGSLETYLNAALKFNLTERLDPSLPRNSLDYIGAVLGPLRFKEAVATVNRVLDQEGALSKNQRTVLKTAFDHMGHIANLRHKLAHQYVMEHPNDPHHWVITDTMTARALSSRRTWVISTATLDRATHDLVVTRDWLGDHRQEHLFNQVSELLPAWLYKPSELAPLPSGRARALQELLHPREASRA